MGAELRIVDEDVVALAGELATLRGLSMDQAVAVALRHELERERDRVAKIQHILALGRDIRAHLREPDGDDDTWLYDADGMPA